FQAAEQFLEELRFPLLTKLSCVLLPADAGCNATFLQECPALVRLKIHSIIDVNSSSSNNNNNNLDSSSLTASNFIAQLTSVALRTTRASDRVRDVMQHATRVTRLRLSYMGSKSAAIVQSLLHSHASRLRSLELWSPERLDGSAMLQPCTRLKQLTLD